MCFFIEEKINAIQLVSALVNVIVQTVLLSFFSVFFINSSLAARAKMSLSRAQNIFMPKNISSITINITLEGIEKMKAEKNHNKTV